MNTSKRIYLYDSTLRDGAQARGVDFTVADKQAIAKALQKVADLLKLPESGYRLIANHGPDSGQEVPHFHMHILGGEPVGKLVS